MAIILSAVDKMSRTVDQAFGKVQKKLSETQAQAERVANASAKVGRQAGVMGLAIAAPLIVAGNMAMDFEKQMSNVSTLIDANTESMEAMGAETLAVASRVPVAIEDITLSLYDIRSAGIAAGDAMGVLEKSAQLSVAGLSTSAEATDIMTSAINTFSAEGMEAAEIADILFKTVKFGKTTMSEVSRSFGATAATVQAAGVQFADFQAATAAMTTLGEPASQAQNKIRQAIVSMQKPTADMAKIMEQLGVTSEKELIAREGGMVGAFEAINKAGEDMGLNLAKAWGSVEAGAAVISLTGATNEAYLNTLKDMTTGANALDEAYRKQAGTAAAQMAIVRNQIKVTGVEIGNILLPILSDILAKILPVIQKVRDWTKANPKLTANIVKGTAALAAFLMVVSAGAFIVSGIAKSIAFLTAVTKAAVFVSAILTKGMMVLNIVLTANPIGLIIVGVAALAAGMIYLWKNSEKFRGTLVGIWEWLKAVSQMITHQVIGQAKALGAILEGVFTLDREKIQKGLKMSAEANVAYQTAKHSLSDKFSAGYERGAAMGGTSDGPAPQTISRVNNGGSSQNVNFNPVINIQGVTNMDKGKFQEVLKEYEGDLMRTLRELNRREARAAY